MKQIRKIFCIVLCIAVFAVLFAACNRKEEQIDEGITVTFVTGFEDDYVIVDPVLITMDKPGILPDEPRYAGYDFTGWYYDAACTVKFSTEDKLKENTVLYAGWNKKRSDGDSSGDGKQVVDSGGLAYLLTEEGTYTVVGYSGSTKELTVPATYQEYDITAIGANAFGNNSQVEKIILSKKIKSIDETAFCGLTSLKNIEVSSESLQFRSVGGVLYSHSETKLLFVGQGRTEAFTLKKTVEDIGKNAFYGCSFAVTIPDDGAMRVVDEFAFAGYKGKLTLSQKINEIRKKAFYGATCEIVFPIDCAIKKLQNGEFDGYKGEKLTLPSSLESVSGSPFFGSTAVLDFEATGLKTLGNSALAGYAGASFVVPYFTENIEANCFYHCTAKVTFDSRTTYSTIKELAFNQFTGEVTFPSTVRKIEKNAFYAASHATITFTTKKSAIEIEESAFNLCSQKNVTYAQ